MRERSDTPAQGLLALVHGRERACALLGAATIAFSSILVRLSHASPSTAAIFRCAYALPVLGWLAWSEDRRLGARSWRERRAGLAAGAFFAADLLLWHHSIGDVGAGLATVLANIQVVILPLVAWALLSERPGRPVLIALPIALLGVLLISGVLEHSAFGRDPTRGTLFGLGAGVAYVGFLLLLRHAGADLRHRTEPRARPRAGCPLGLGQAARSPSRLARSGGRRVVQLPRLNGQGGRGSIPAASVDARRPIHPVAGPLFDATAVATLVCIAAGLVIGDARLVPSWPGAGWLIVLALTSQVLGWLLISSSLPRLPAALTSVLLTLQPVGSVALAALIFGESPSRLQLLGVGLVLVALLAAGRYGPGRRVSADGPARPAPSELAPRGAGIGGGL